MSNPYFYIVDVFSEKKYAGNQLAVFRNCENLSTSEMQTLALEMNYSETTFILSETENNGGYDVRIFTPGAELPFAGHPTLGTAFIIQSQILNKKVATVNLNLKVGQIPVSLVYDGEELDLLWMKQIPPVFGNTIDPEVMAEVLNIDIDDIDSRFPAAEVSTGMPTMIVALKNLKAVRKANINKAKYTQFMNDFQTEPILIFSPETYSDDKDLNVRFFADCFGIPEDPATGSANGCLAGYLVKHKFFGAGQIDIKVEQGYEIKRPSLLYLKAQETDNDIEVNVGGKVFLIAKGELL